MQALILFPFHSRQNVWHLVACTTQILLSDEQLTKSYTKCFKKNNIQYNFCPGYNGHCDKLCQKNVGPSLAIILEFNSNITQKTCKWVSEFAGAGTV